MKSLKLAALAALAIFLTACDYASESASINGSSEAMASTQITLEAPEPPREMKVCNTAQELADAYLEAQNNKDRQALLDLVYWGDVVDRKRVEKRMCTFLGKNTLFDVVVTPIKKSFQEVSMKGYETRGVRYVPNIPVGAVLTPKSEIGDGQIEIGRHEDRWYLVAHIPE